MLGILKFRKIRRIAIESSECCLRVAGNIYFSDGNNDSFLLYLKQNNPKLGTRCKPQRILVHIKLVGS